MNVVDLPEYYEDHMQEWFGGFQARPVHGFSVLFDEKFKTFRVLIILL